MYDVTMVSHSISDEVQIVSYVCRRPSLIFLISTPRPLLSFTISFTCRNDLCWQRKSLQLALLHDTMAPGASRKRPAKVEPDFKRIKAKVGKRAPKKANVTDTTFKAASLTVRAQAVDVASTAAALAAPDSQQELYTSRGRTINDLITQLKHPAASVRQSAAKGLKDIIFAKNRLKQIDEDFRWLQGHLSSLIPATARCLIDEDDDVREVGLSVLREILNKLSDSRTIGALRPFGPLLIAYISSSLNSLDKGSRRDGAIAIEMLGSYADFLIENQVAEILPAFVRLLSEHRLFRFDEGSAGNGNKSRKKRGRQQSKQGKQNTERFSLLRSLLVLLKSSSGSSQASIADGHSSISRIREPDLIVSPDGRSRSAILVRRPGHSNICATKVSTRFQLSAIAQLKQSSMDRQKLLNGKENDTLSPKAGLGLLEKIRDALIEASQHGTQTSKADFYLPGGELETFLLLVETVEVFFGCFGNDMFQDYSRNEDRMHDTDRLIAVTSKQIANLLLECFPLRLEDSQRRTFYYANEQLCAAILAVAKCVQSSTDDRTRWVKTVAKHVVNSLTFHKEDHGSDSRIDTTLVVTPVLRLLEELVMNGSKRILQDAELFSRLMSAFGSTFFCENDIERKFALSQAGRRAVYACNEILMEYDYVLVDAEKDIGSIVYDIVRRIPCYIVAWGIQYPLESFAALTMLHHVVRHMVNDSGEIREHLSEGLLTLLRNQEAKGDEETLCGSIFERYPEELQHLSFTLLLRLGPPSTTFLSSLSSICSRSFLGLGGSIHKKMATSIIRAIHSIRRSLSMQSYLSYVIDSVGFMSECDTFSPKAESDTLGDELTYAIARNLDDGVKTACSCLVECGSLKVLSMMCPLLTVCLSSDCSNDRTKDLIRLRTALAIMAMLSLDMERYGGFGEQSVFGVLPANMESVVVGSLVTLFLNTPFVGGDSNERYCKFWIKPIVALMSKEPQLLVLTLERISVEPEKSSQNCLSWFVAVMMCPVIFNAMKESDRQLLFSHAQVLDCAHSDGALQHLSGRIRVEAELWARGGNEQ